LATRLRPIPQAVYVIIPEVAFCSGVIVLYMKTLATTSWSSEAMLCVLSEDDFAAGRRRAVAEVALAAVLCDAYQLDVIAWILEAPGGERQFSQLRPGPE
jgi:hypothetical protein